MNIFLADEQDVPLSTEPLRRFAQVVLEAEGLPSDTEVAILLVTDDQMADYNKRFMNKEGPTDVLAFPLEELEPGVAPSPVGDAPFSLGDVIIAPGYVRGMTTERETDLDSELALMVAHGLLHLLGYDHGNDQDAATMEGRERELLAQIGVERT